MGLFKWLLCPVTGPVYGTKWVAEQLLEEAERQYYDETLIHQEMLDLERSYEQGTIDRQTLDRCTEPLLQRLLEARDWRNERGEN